ncbi:unnamed protein product [Adineta steineri]|uniref:Uncharacterized protein n=1 Tax=Adineta steineri TaxID=433720 RepID=A0A815CNC6_9BILA|nr:unnamed protein product [Adineta steineri]CAF1338021.1 unnamed protein product [Adineta steineri]CAF1467136.1 unnamed protein product [Adineta steineri]CAF3751009.1 unnamed protein product [Adineta steineri]CAF3980903.1 unnamed protein product [Adineta steineri]
MSNCNKQQQHNTNIPAMHVHNPVNNQQEQKNDSSSAWSNREETQGIEYLVKPSSTLLATAPFIIPSSSLVQPNKINDILPIEDTTPSSFYWNSNDYLSLNPVQRPSSELRTTTFPTYSPMNYTMVNSNST